MHAVLDDRVPAARAGNGMVSEAQPYPAYEATGALHIACPNCGASVGQYCVTTDGIRRVRNRRVPCVQRMVAASQDDPSKEWSPTSALASTGGACGDTDGFSEPLHPREDFRR